MKVPKNQTRLDSLFGLANKQEESPKIVLSTTITDSEVQRFYNSLHKAEKIAHEIASLSLGTSYDVRRTHGFRAWQKQNA